MLGRVQVVSGERVVAVEDAAHVGVRVADERASLLLRGGAEPELDALGVKLRALACRVVGGRVLHHLELLGRRILEELAQDRLVLLVGLERRVAERRRLASLARVHRVLLGVLEVLEAPVQHRGRVDRVSGQADDRVRHDIRGGLVRRLGLGELLPDVVDGALGARVGGRDELVDAALERQLARDGVAARGDIVVRLLERLREEVRRVVLERLREPWDDFAADPAPSAGCGREVVSERPRARHGPCCAAYSSPGSERVLDAGQRVLVDLLERAGGVKPERRLVERIAGHGRLDDLARSRVRDELVRVDRRRQQRQDPAMRDIAGRGAAELLHARERLGRQVNDVGAEAADDVAAALQEARRQLRRLDRGDRRRRAAERAVHRDRWGLGLGGLDVTYGARYWRLHDRDASRVGVGRQRLRRRGRLRHDDRYAARVIRRLEVGRRCRQLDRDGRLRLGGDSFQHG